MSGWQEKCKIIAHPSEKGGYNANFSGLATTNIIAHPSEKGGYN